MILSQEASSLETLPPGSIYRRNVLSTLGLTGIGLLATSATSSAFTSKKEIPKVTVQTASSTGPQLVHRFSPLPDLPGEWSAHNGAAAEYLRYLTSLNLQRVDPKQVIAAHAKAKGSTWNSLPPKQWWNRMGYVLKVVNRVAREMNVDSVEIISAYRSPAYNARCAGAKAGSWHQANVAVDVKFPDRASKVTATARQLRDLGLFKGGVGGYWNFTHIDARGQNVNW
jgi:hypothetical protein